MTALIAKTLGERFQIQCQQPSLFEKEMKFYWQVSY